jgi:D-amino-acid oxidase
MHIVVLGAGMSGLTSSFVLAQAGHRITVVSADTAHTTSHLAAAVWFPTASGPAEAVARWSTATFGRIAGEAAAQVPGVLMRQSMNLYREEPGVPAWTTAVAELRVARPDELPPGYSHGLRYVVPLVEMPRYLPWLLDRVTAAGGALISARVESLAELEAFRPDVIVNAAGLAAGPLVGDDSTYPVRGQIVRVANPGLALSVRDEGHPGGRAYVHPRTTDCILGGTLDVGAWDTTPDLDETERILSRCADIVPELAGARPLETIVGLRPGRPEIRLELDTSLLSVPVVHNYGHGGSGITVGWGCAENVLAIVEQI